MNLVGMKVSTTKKHLIKVLFCVNLSLFAIGCLLLTIITMFMMWIILILGHIWYKEIRSQAQMMYALIMPNMKKWYWYKKNCIMN